MTTATMNALVYEGPRTMNIRELPIPEPAEDEVLIRVEKVGICGSELGGYLGHNSLRKPPLVMGHEFAGSVERIGAAVSHLQAGDRVTVNPLVSCGICRYCTNGQAQLCPKRSLLGAHRPGAFAGYVAVPVKNVFRLPDGVSMEEGAFAEPFACAVHLLRMLRLTPTDKLLIVGAGPIGLFTLQAAHVYGLRDVTVLDLNRSRLEIAAELGAVCATTLAELDESLREGAYDAAVDAVGAAVTRRQCIDAVRPGGQVMFTGLHEADSSLPINTAIRSEIRMTGAFAYAPEDFAAALQWIGEGRVSMMPWTETVALAAGGESFEKLIQGPGKTAKILLDPWQ
ncbi:zinc-dependent alcohol dehydrogenase [Paenibacillus cymbidii]|uniref:zinc-dependent alcohol dehydrogenase n=1 Tax=Paenibacillus cymbidii TaxID=1639034 RepID=UPI001F19C686|nr:alcohol dehydrogenase catalytic domain-containing protein [Paenibacillus cymbidii]